MLKMRHARRICWLFLLSVCSIHALLAFGGETSSWRRSTPGVHPQNDGTVVIVVSLPAVERYPDWDALEAQSMLQVHRLLADHVLPKVRCPFPGVMDVATAANVRFSPFRYRGTVRILFKGIVAQEYRYVAAFPETDIAQSIATIAWHDYARNLFKMLRQQQDFQVLADFMCAIGSVEDAVSYARQAWLKANGLVGLPQDVTDLESAALKSFANGLHLQAMGLRLAAAIHGDASLHFKETAKIARQLGIRKSNSALLEYARFCEEFADTHAGVDILGQPDHVLTIAMVKRSWGHVHFASLPEGANVAAQVEAENLFNAGGRLANIVVLLEDVIAQQPRNPRAWKYYGAVLVAQQNWKEAGQFLTQSLNLDDGDAEVRCNLSQCYLALGYSKLAEGMAWGAWLAPDQTPWSSKKSTAVLLTMGHHYIIEKE